MWVSLSDLIPLFPTELASAQVKVLPESPKKSVFHRKAKVNTETGASEENLQQTEAQDTEQKAQEEKPAFVFTASKEEFRFNFVWFVSRRRTF